MPKEEVVLEEVNQRDLLRLLTNDSKKTNDHWKQMKKEKKEIKNDVDYFRKYLFLFIHFIVWLYVSHFAVCIFDFNIYPVIWM